MNAEEIPWTAGFSELPSWAQERVLRAKPLTSIANAAMTAAIAEQDDQRQSNYLTIAKRKIASAQQLAAIWSFIKLSGVEAVESNIRVLEERLSERGFVVPAPQAQHKLVAVIDTETTGIEQHDEAIAVGILLLRVEVASGRFVEEVDCYLGLREPSVPIHPRAQEVHGISIQQLRGQQFNWSIILPLLSASEMLIAHNARFDRRMLAALHAPLTEKLWGCSCWNVRWPAMANRKLDTLCAHFGVSRQEPHDALSDCRSLAAILFKHSGKTQRSRAFMAHILSDPYV